MTIGHNHFLPRKLTQKNQHITIHAMNVLSYSPEKKYISHSYHFESAKCFLDSLLLKDPQYAEGSVKSIYFDTHNFSSLYEKLDGDFLKRKIRFRWYETKNASETHLAGSVSGFLEIKDKAGSGRKKIRQTLSLPLHLLESHLELMEFFKPHIEQILIRCDTFSHHQIMPTVLISYKRFRYICPFSQARVSLDSEIKSEISFGTFFSARTHRPVEVIVLEIKDCLKDGVPWIAHLQEFGFKYGNFSKYGTCLSLSKGVLQ